jgi:hypothetical protein
MKPDLYHVGLIAVLAFLLLVADRIIRINPYLASEGFQVAGQPQRCGTDLEPCPFPKRCMNGFCYGEDTPQMYDRNPLPVLP